jgi:hypothetical protein
MLQGTVVGDAPTTSGIAFCPKRLAAAFLSIGAPPTEAGAKAMKQVLAKAIADSPPRLGGVGVADLLRFFVLIRTDFSWYIQLVLANLNAIGVYHPNPS